MVLGETYLSGPTPLCSAANRCKKAQVRSCTECIRVDKDCAYCTDEVCCCPAGPPPPPAHPPLGSGRVHICPTLGPALGQLGVGERARVQEN